MTEIRLEDVASLNGIISAAAVTRNGEYIEGTVPQNARKDTFAAMSAVLLGASERLAVEINSGMKCVSVNFNDCTLTVLGIDSVNIIASVLSSDADPKDFLSAVKSLKEKYRAPEVQRMQQE